jgi:hypothetical protein
MVFVESAVFCDRFVTVLPGLDPGIHQVPWPPASATGLHGHLTRNRVDARVIAGLDPGTGDDGVDTVAGSPSLHP